jgi:hypothetical protein
MIFFEKILKKIIFKRLFSEIKFYIPSKYESVIIIFLKVIFRDLIILNNYKLALKQSIMDKLEIIILFESIILICIAY